MNLHPGEGIRLFMAGHTPGWGELEVRLDNVVVEGIKQVDIVEKHAEIYCRDVDGHWPIFDGFGRALTYWKHGNWTVTPVYPPDKEFDEPRNRKPRGKKK